MSWGCRSRSASTGRGFTPQKTVAQIRQDIPSLRDEIDQLAKEKLDPLELNTRLKPVKAHLAKTAGAELEASLDYMKKNLGLSAEYVKALRWEITKAAQPSDTGAKSTAALDTLQTFLRIHPAIDFHEEFMTVGFRVDQGDGGDGILLFISEGQGGTCHTEIGCPTEAIEMTTDYDLGQAGQAKKRSMVAGGDRAGEHGTRVLVNPESVECGGQTYRVKRGAPPFVNDTWDLDRLRNFIQNPTSLQTLFGDLKQVFRAYLDLPAVFYALMAVWAIATFFAHMFTAFPFLDFYGPKECGKSKSLEALRCVCFNPWKGRDITAAALGDTTDGQRRTLLLDQAEKLGDAENGKLIGLLADSYKKAGGLRRVVQITKAVRSVLEFSTYGPKAFASTKSLDPDLADRCIHLPMTRTLKKLPDLEGWEPVWPELRDKLYRFALCCFKIVRAHYQSIEGNGTRIGELWRPMQAVLLALCVEQREIEEIRTLFTAGAEEGRHELGGWESRLFDVLRQKAEEGQEAFEMTSEDILKAMDIQGETKPGGSWIGKALSQFSLPSIRPPYPRKNVDGRRRKVTVYPFNSTHILKLYEIYMRVTPLDGLSHMSQAENVNDSGNSNGTGKKQGTSPKVSQLADPEN